jgi:hypothetical protein
MRFICYFCRWTKSLKLCFSIDNESLNSEHDFALAEFFERETAKAFQFRVTNGS